MYLSDRVAINGFQIMGAENKDLPLSKEIIDDCNRIVETYQKELLHYATSLLQNPTQAEDVVQEGLIRYIRFRVRSPHPIDNPRAWLYRTIHNLIMDILRKERRWRTIQDHIQYQKTHEIHRHSPETNLLQEEKRHIMWQLIMGLPPREQQILLLKIIEHKSYREIAEIMNLTVTNVGFILHTTIKKMVKELNTKKCSYEQS